jgi:arsenate reductase-like glutaredoxin family protein
MGMISTDKNMIKLYYSSESSIGEQTYSYLNASFKDILAIDVTKTKVTGSQWKDISEHLGINISDLIEKNRSEFTKLYEDTTTLDDNGWIKILDNSPEVLVYPIVIIGDNYFQIKNPSDIEKKLAPNSKGIDEKKHI